MSASLPILTFHAFDDRPSVVSIPFQVFQHGIANLHESGYRTLGLMDAVDCIRRGSPFPDRSFVLTFDDGYQTVYKLAFPLLKRYGMSAIVFPTLAASGASTSKGRLSPQQGRALLSWGEMKEMQRGGISFGSHTLTHPNLRRLTAKMIEAEVCGSKAMIEDNLGAPVTCFAYPFGRYDSQSRDVVRQHFECACSDRLSFVTTGSDLYTLERIDAYYLRTKRLFDVMLSRYFPWYIRARNLPRRVRRRLTDLLR